MEGFFILLHFYPIFALMAAPIFFKDDNSLANALQSHIENASKTFILTDSNVADAVLPRILSNLFASENIEIIEVEPGEDSKSIEVAIQIWRSLLECNADRKTLLLNIGGGVITDLGGFVASTYKRGIDFIHIPTSLMAMTDAAIGGKTGIDHDQFKNVVGTFAEAKAILIQPDFISTLDESEILSGFAEMIKHGIIADPILFEALEAIEGTNKDHISLFIERSALIKESIIRKDFNETGLRKTLNFGHTIGHAIESASLNSSPLSHGYAVGLGMQVEISLAFNKGIVNSNDYTRIQKLLSLHFPKKQKFNWEELLTYLKNDKKNEKDELRFALPNALGSASWDIAANELEIQAAMGELINE
jgi:3-dehydroquinate synthase